MGRDVGWRRETPVMRVSEVSRIIRESIEGPHLQNIIVRGEISGYTHHRSGHRYFSLIEDLDGKPVILRCVMFRYSARRLPFTPEDGQQVLAMGDVQVYEPRGVYQLVVRDLSPTGTGDRYVRIERWKEMLKAEGVFSPERKRPLPRYPKTVGVVTSPTGAALQDILHVLRRRFPVEVILSPTQVQGEGVHEEIARALEAIDGRVDVIILGRGGGSAEDLFSFNHPRVVRAVANAVTPVISAVGHEIDWTLADHAADVRAPTPSAAAELAVPDRLDLLADLQDLGARLHSALRSRLDLKWRTIEELEARLQPARLRRLVTDRMQQTADLNDRLVRALHSRLEHLRLELRELAARLEVHNPYHPLKKGYCMIERDGTIVDSVDGIAPGDRLDIHLRDGTCNAEVREVHHNGREL